MEGSSVQVCIRFRPLNDRESKNGEKENFRVSADAQTITLSAASAQKDSQWTFDHVFDPRTTTVQVYDKVAKKIILSSLDGFNGTIFAYGQTSSGKTHTMYGGSKEAGIITLAVRELFEYVAMHPEREYLFRVSFMEIYNECVKDLLKPEGRENLAVRDDKGHIFVDGLTEEMVTNPDQVLRLLQEGEAHRHVGATSMNERSSRSHTICRMIIESKDREDGDVAVRVSTLNLVDLAGSERAKATGAQGDRLREGSHINKSLLVLSKVIKALTDEHVGALVPYRESKLTRILQPALGGNSLTAIICAATLASGQQAETVSTLSFAKLAKFIKNKASVNEFMSDEALKYKQAIHDLKEQLNKSKESTAKVEELQQQLQEFEKTREDLGSIEAQLKAEIARREEAESRAAALRREAELRAPSLYSMIGRGGAIVAGSVAPFSSFLGGAVGSSALSGVGSSFASSSSSSSDMAGLFKKRNRRETWAPNARLALASPMISSPSEKKFGSFLDAAPSAASSSSSSSSRLSAGNEEMGSLSRPLSFASASPFSSIVSSSSVVGASSSSPMSAAAPAFLFSKASASAAVSAASLLSAPAKPISAIPPFKGPSKRSLESMESSTAPSAVAANSVDASMSAFGDSSIIPLEPPTSPSDSKSRKSARLSSPVKSLEEATSAVISMPSSSSFEPRASMGTKISSSSSSSNMIIVEAAPVPSMEEITALKSELAAVKARAEVLKSENGRLQSEVERFQEEIELRNDPSFSNNDDFGFPGDSSSSLGAGSMFASSSSSSSALQSQVEQLQARKQALEAEVSRLQTASHQQAVALEAELSMAQESRTQLCGLVESLQQRVQASEEELHTTSEELRSAARAAEDRSMEATLRAREFEVRCTILEQQLQESNTSGLIHASSAPSTPSSSSLRSDLTASLLRCESLAAELESAKSQSAADKALYESKVSELEMKLSEKQAEFEQDMSATTAEMNSKLEEMEKYLETKEAEWIEERDELEADNNQLVEERDSLNQQLAERDEMLNELHELQKESEAAATRAEEALRQHLEESAKSEQEWKESNEARLSELRQVHQRQLEALSSQQRGEADGMANFVKEANERIASLESEIDNLEQQLAASQEEISAMSGAMEEATESLLKREYELSETQTELKKMETTNAALSTRVAELEATEQEMSRIQEEMKDQIIVGEAHEEALKTELESLKSEAESLKNTNILLDSEVMQLKQHASSFESQIADMKQAAEARAIEFESLSSESKALWTQNDEFRAALSKAQSSLSAAEKDLEILRPVRDELKVTILELQRTVERAEEAEHIAQRAQAILVEKEEQTQAAIQKAMLDAEEVRREKAALVSEAIHTRSQVSMLEAKIYEMDKEREKQERDPSSIVRLRDENGRLSAELADLKKQVKGFQMGRESAEKDKAMRQKEFDKLQERLKVAEAKVQQVSKDKQAAVGEKAASERDSKEAKKLMEKREKENERLKAMSKEADDRAKEALSKVSGLEYRINEAVKTTEKTKAQLVVAETELAARIHELEKTKKECHELNTAYIALTSDKQSAETKIRELKEEVEQGDAVQTELSNRLMQFSERCQQLDSEKTEVQQRVEVLSKELSNATLEGQRLSAELTTASGAASGFEALSRQLAAELESVKSEAERLSQELAAAQSLSNQLCEQNTELQSDLEELKLASQEAEKELNERNQRLAEDLRCATDRKNELEIAHTGLQNDFKEVQVLVAESLSKMEQTEIERSQLQHDLLIQQQEVARLADMERQLTESLNNSEAHNSSLLMDKAQLEQSLHLLTEQHKTLTHERDDLQHTSRSLSSDLQSVRTKLQSSESAVQRLTAELEREEEKYNKLEKEQRDTQRARLEAERDLASSRGTATRLQSDLQARKTDLASTSSSLARMQEQNQRLQEECSELQPFREKYMEAESQRRDLEREVAGLREDCTRYTHEISRLRDENLSIARRVSEQEDAGRRALGAALSEHSSASSERIRDLQSRLVATERDLEEHKHALSTAKSTASTASEESHRLAAQLQKVEATAVAYASKISLLETVVQRLKQKAEKADDLERETEELVMECQNLKDAQYQFEIEIQENRSRADTYQAEIKKLQASASLSAAAAAAASAVDLVEFANIKASLQRYEAENKVLIEKVEKLTLLTASAADANRIKSLEAEIKRRDDKISHLTKKYEEYQSKYAQLVAADRKKIIELANSASTPFTVYEDAPASVPSMPAASAAPALVMKPPRASLASMPPPAALQNITNIAMDVDLHSAATKPAVKSNPARRRSVSFADPSM